MLRDNMVHTTGCTEPVICNNTMVYISKKDAASNQKITTFLAKRVTGTDGLARPPGHTTQPCVLIARKINQLVTDIFVKHGERLH